MFEHVETLTFDKIEIFENVDNFDNINFIICGAQFLHKCLISNNT